MRQVGLGVSGFGNGIGFNAGARKPLDWIEEMSNGGIVEITMPAMGESVTEGTILGWLKNEGEYVSEGETIVEVSTDKIDAEVPAPSSGVITKIMAGVDDTIAIGDVLATLDTNADESQATPGGNGSSGAATSTASQAAPGLGSATGEGGADLGEAGPGQAVTSDGRRVSPVARRVAAARNINLDQVSGSGINGKILKDDVLSAEPGSAAPEPDDNATQLRGPAAMLAQAMNNSREVPTATSFRTIAVDTLDAKRRALNSALADQGTKLSFTHIIAWAIILAAREFPVMARTYSERGGKPYVTENPDFGFGLAVDVERKGGRGLVVPCVKGAGESVTDFREFHAAYEDLVKRTRENALTADDFQGVNITLTNPGGLGTVASVPRLMSGQGSIIATGSIAYPAEWAHAPADTIKALGISKVMTMTSTYDHRIIQGAESGGFLRRVDQLLQGEDNFYESLAEAFELSEGVVATAYPASASAPPLATGTAQQTTGGSAPIELLQAVQAATSLLKAYRTHGHLAAHLSPLGTDGEGDPALVPENLNLTPDLMAQIPASILRIGVEGETLLEALPRMREAYCGRIAYQIEHLSSHQQRVWLREMIETGRHRTPLEPEEQKRLLARLIDVFEFERFLQKTYLGQKMFSIEGLDVLVPMLDEAATLAKRGGGRELVLGMAHRGRLSVLAHNLNRPADSIMAEFEGAKAIDAVKAISALPHAGTGDVKYHHGAEGMLETADGEEIMMRLYPNPSHLEFVDPVVTGGARAEQTDRSGPEAVHDPSSVVPILMHGDAAFPGQGVVAETLNLQALEGYSTGGTVHIITNNQVGFTTDPIESRSTPYASDIAKGFNCPIIMVNADDVEAAISAVRLAMAYRERWQRDIVIDLIGYRRYGHNETDEPAYTQPTMAREIAEHPPVSKLYAEKLIKDGVVDAEWVEERSKSQVENLRSLHKRLLEAMEKGEFEDPSSTLTGTGELDRSKSPEVDTRVDADTLRELNKELIKVPESFTIHRKLRKPLQRRLELLEEGPIEFAHAESLAFASLLAEGKHIRLTGQDTERGTFSNRHLALHDENTGMKYVPIQHLPQAKAPFELHNSPLSEIGCLGFEYGYSVASTDSLILWEAQFGDFANSAQVIIDSFIVSGESKWGAQTRLTMLLPHGYEGAGPEHSSARIERFIQLGSEGNIRIANPTTAAQYFHLLRRQALIAKPRPLIVMTPKSLLRLPAAGSKLSDLTDGRFEFVLDDPNAPEKRERIERLVLCSGKIYYDIDAHERRQSNDKIAVARVELLYPFARDQIADLIASYPNLKEILWVQEEPRNMGGWSVMVRRLPELVPEGCEFRYVGRPQRASPSEGYPAAHRSEQERIVLTALQG